MNPDQGDNFWKETESQGTMPLADNVISGEVQPTQEIPLGHLILLCFLKPTLYWP